MPGLTDFKKIIKETKEFTDEYLFENINIRPNNQRAINKYLKENHPELTKIYNSLTKEKWDQIEKEITEYCKKEKIKHTSTMVDSKKILITNNFYTRDIFKMLLVPSNNLINSKVLHHSDNQ
ncbi:hypothetical protein K9L97_02840 [Candidatus Woesearchaeota archaeon]|nr:hypothetical protein [Candidatus Woesearchaeota archaeon]